MVSLTDSSDMTKDVYCARKTTTQQQLKFKLIEKLYLRLIASLVAWSVTLKFAVKQAQ